MSSINAHIVALSGGKDSTAMALRLAESEPRDYDHVITPTGRELPEMIDHWLKLGCLLGKPLKPIPSVSLDSLIKRWNCLPSWRRRFCTGNIKIEPFKAYAASRAPAVVYVGIRADEAGMREGTAYDDFCEVTQDYPLVRWGWGINQVKRYLAERCVEIPERTDCDVCFFQQLAEWWRLWKLHPDRWREGEEYEAVTGETFRSPGRDTWPASMAGLRKMFEAGNVPKGADQLNLRLDVAERPTMCAWCAR